jgi:hypothetical protein
MSSRGARSTRAKVVKYAESDDDESAKKDDNYQPDQQQVSDDEFQRDVVQDEAETGIKNIYLAYSHIYSLTFWSRKETET